MAAGVGVVWWWALALAAPVEGIEVLGVDATGTVLAVRETYDANDAVYDCGYAGHPGHLGVKLHLLEEAKVSSWTVYRRADKASECTPNDTSVQRLAAAKAAFAAAGVELRPVELVPAAKGDELRVQIGGVERVIQVATQQPPLVAEFHRRAGIERLRDPTSERWGFGGASLLVDGEPWRHIYASSPPGIMASSLTLEGAVPVGPAAAVVTRAQEGGMHWEDEPSYSLHVLAPGPVVLWRVEAPRFALPDDTRRVELLDFDPGRGLALVKVTSHGGPTSLACAYPGVQQPTDGVLITVWDFAAGSMVYGHEVYVAADEHRGCSAPADSVRILAEAKEQAAAFGLTVDDRPQAVPMVRGVAVVAGKELVFEPGRLSVGGRQLATGEDVHGVWLRDGVLVVALQQRKRVWLKRWNVDQL